MVKTNTFIGCSVQSLDIAYSVQENLEHDTTCTVWPQGIFDMSSSNLDSLVASLPKFDFGIFLLSPDDVSRIKGEEYSVARDNVIFELGLFIGRLGKSRNFIIVPRGLDKFHFPTDLIGVNPGDYDSEINDNNYLAALGPVCNKIRRAIRASGAFISSHDIKDIRDRMPASTHAGSKTDEEKFAEMQQKIEDRIREANR